MQASQPIGLLHHLFFNFLRQIQLADTLNIPLRFCRAVLCFAQLLVDGLHLLPQIIIPLILIHLAAHFGLNLFLQAQNFHFSGELFGHQRHSPANVQLFQHLLFLWIFQVGIPRDIIAQKSHFRVVCHIEGHVAVYFRRKVYIIHKKLPQAANHGLVPFGRLVWRAFLQRFHRHCIIRLGGFHFYHPSPADALHQYPENVAVDFENLLNAAHRAYFV